MKICLNEMKIENIPIFYEWRLNERHYGALQGLNKAETAQKYGEEQVLLWRRSYDIPPPKLEVNDKRHPNYDLKYNELKKNELPSGESLKDTANRVIPYLKNEIMPLISSGKNILVSAHGNSIRAIVMDLQNYSPEQILKTEIGWCEPWVFEFENDAVVNLDIVSRPGSKSMSRLPD